eukprot:gene3646-2581_t
MKSAKKPNLNKKKNSKQIQMERMRQRTAATRIVPHICMRWCSACHVREFYDMHHFYPTTRNKKNQTNNKRRKIDTEQLLGDAILPYH